MPSSATAVSASRTSVQVSNLCVTKDLERLAAGVDVGVVSLDVGPETRVITQVQKVGWKSACSQYCVVDGHLDVVECENPFLAFSKSDS